MLRTLPSRRRLRGSLLVFAVLLFGLAKPAQAHPLGNFSINLYSRIEPGVDQVALTYVVDMAEIPSYQEFGPQPLGAQAQVDYLAQKAAELRDGLQLTVDGQRQPLEVTGQTISFPAGQGGLFTTRIELELVSPLPRLATGEQRRIAYEDTNYAGRLGWHEVVVQALPGAQIVQTDAPSSDLSDELRAYPDDMLSSPPDVRTAQASIKPGAATERVDREQATAPQRSTDQFAALLSTTQLTPMVVALLTALGLGAVHALSPGHGKTIVAAYLIGARGTARHALFLGFTVTATHTIGVFILGLVTLYASRYVLPEQLYSWLSIISGGMVIVMGLTLLRQRWRSFYGHADGHTHHHHHTHQHDHEHDHQHVDHAHHHHEHDHQHDHEHHDHQHEHDHQHDHEHHDHQHEHEHAHHTHSHAHGAHTHTHLPPGADGQPITWRSLLALGISGGLVPCPSALVVMLGAIAVGRTGFGLLLIVAFSLGLAGVLTGVGILFVYGGRWVSHVGQGKYRQFGRRLQLVPLVSALVVTIAGCVITAQALIQAGLV